jgi:hypothetical protein
MIVFNLMCSLGVRFKSMMQIRQRVSVGVVSGQVLEAKKVHAAIGVHHPYLFTCTLKRATETFFLGS